MNSDLARIIQVTNVESMDQAEDWVGFKPVSEIFGQNFYSEVRSPELFEVQEGDGYEYMLGVCTYVAA